MYVFWTVLGGVGYRKEFSFNSRFNGAESSCNQSLHRQLVCAIRRHSIFGHVRRLPDCTPAHMPLKLLAVCVRSGTTPWLEPFCWQYLDKPDCAGQRTGAVDAWAVGAEGTMTHSWLHAAVSEYAVLECCAEINQPVGILWCPVL